MPLRRDIMDEYIPNNDNNKTINIGIRISFEAKKHIDELAKRNRRSRSKEIERLIMEAE